MTNTNFTFRSKFEKLLNNENRPIIVAAFEKFFKLQPDSARDLLWRMTYNMEVTAVAALAELGLNQEIISFEKIPCLRNELRHQYNEVAHPNFLVVTVPGECQEAFDALLNHTDPIVANIVYEHCQSHLYVDEGSMNRLLYLLGSDKENNFFGGIRSLQFTPDESFYLKPHHLLIHNLLNALYEDYRAQRSPMEDNRPFAGLAGLIEEAGMNLPFNFEEVAQEACDEAIEEVLAEMEAEAPVEAPTEVPAEPVQTDSRFKPLTAEAIIANKDVFASFLKDNDMNALFQIGMLGFDLNEVMSKSEKMNNLLKAAEAVEKAKEKLKKAEAKMSKATEALFK